MQTAPIQLKVQEQRLRWYEHMLRRPQDHSIEETMGFEVQGKRPRGAPKKWKSDVNKMDLSEVEPCITSTCTSFGVYQRYCCGLGECCGTVSIFGWIVVGALIVVIILVVVFVVCKK
ncbi:hypothetical protein TELCIR_01179 [Teladorsagia circumcincta]|uniref:Uncharacterized protein n=1 Tax=Teladorsagia circumcincta TaxID=45464 RepID=A0A2G9V2J9_TELCI|nr:hypothetical protein TELCIR_01179 [Teladorsagia circumcincta]